MDFSRLLLKNKYFSTEIPVKLLGFHENFEASGPFALVILFSTAAAEFITKHLGLVGASECNILFAEAENEAAEALCDENGIEFVWEHLGSFTEMKRINGEMIGVGRVKEAIECAAAGFIKQVKKEEEKKEPTEEEIEKDMENFEYFLNKIKDTKEISKGLDDESRKKYAEDTIRELVEYLKINEDLEI